MGAGRSETRRMAAFAGLLAIASVIVACTTSSVIVPPATGTMSQVTRNTAIAAGASGNVSASCPANTQMTSGGYYVQGTPERFVASASYPTAVDTWTASATARADGPITLYAYANCLHAKFSIGERIVSEDWNAPSHQETAHAVVCPSGTTVTGSGYALRMNGAYVVSAFPGTQAASGELTTPYGTVAAYDQDPTTGSGTSYALCADATMISTAQQQSTRNVTSGDDTAMTVGCSSGVLVGGGFGTSLVDPTTPLYAFRSSAASGFLYWQVDLAYHNDARPLSVIGTALCATLTGPGTPAADTPTVVAGTLPVQDGYPGATPVPFPTPTPIPTPTAIPTPTPAPGPYISLTLTPSQFCQNNPTASQCTGQSGAGGANCKSAGTSADYPTLTLTNIGGQTATWSGTDNVGILVQPASGSLAPNQTATVHLTGVTFALDFTVHISWPVGATTQEVTQVITCV
jgi:hypothetical protein